MFIYLCYTYYILLVIIAFSLQTNSNPTSDIIFMVPLDNLVDIYE